MLSLDYKHMKENKPSPMNDFRINLLENIGFEWSLKPFSSRQNAWNEKFEELKAYRKVHGNCDVPQVGVSKMLYLCFAAMILL